MDARELDELERLAKAATPGPYVYNGHPFTLAGPDAEYAIALANAAPRLIAAARLQGDPGLLREALEACWMELEREHGHSSAWPDDTWPACRATHAALRAARTALAASPPESEPLDVERLARAEHASYAREPGAKPIKWSDLTPNEKSMWRRHAAVRAAEYARLSEPAQPDQ